LLRGSEPGIDRVDHLGQATAPCLPVGRIHDHVRIACTAIGKALAEAITQFGQALARRSQPACPVEKVQEVGEAIEFQQLLARPWHGHTRLSCPLFQNGRLKAAFEVRMHLGFR
jgi:hypothetical protein